MRRNVSLCLFCVTLSFFVGTVLDLGYCWFFGPGLWHPTIACDHAVQDLGKLSGDEPASCKFTIRNTGSQPLIIEKATPGCGSCIKVTSFPTEPIQPKQEGVIHAMLLAKRLKEGRVEKTLAVVSNDPQQPAFILSVHARIEKRQAQEEQQTEGDREERASEEEA